ncbi:MAG: tRNA lysidine(34) synthetase TilS [Myxococcales bacterium]|nr:tRNA lysidine(34) synthetase TilS [Myxococcales bacterium]
MSTPGRLRHRVGACIVERGLWSEGDRVAVAVSGGVDSVSLLDLLCATQSWHAGQLSVITVDHAVRPDSSADADFVEQLAAERDLPCSRFELALSERPSEAEMREARYAVMDALDVERVALGHHRGDLAETVLINLIRGTGSSGLSGMAHRRGRYVRPLLDLSREDVMAWAQHRNLQFREDPTNRDSRFLRNRIRNEVLPLLERIRAGSEASIARSARVVASDDALLMQLADDAAASLRTGSIGTDWISTTPEPLVRRKLLALDTSLTAAQIDAALRAAHRGHGDVHLPGGRVIRVRSGALRIVQA